MKIWHGLIYFFGISDHFMTSVAIVSKFLLAYSGSTSSNSSTVLTSPGLLVVQMEIGFLQKLLRMSNSSNQPQLLIIFFQLKLPNCTHFYMKARWKSNITNFAKAAEHSLTLLAQIVKQLNLSAISGYSLVFRVQSLETP